MDFNIGLSSVTAFIRQHTKFIYLKLWKIKLITSRQMILHFGPSKFYQDIKLLHIEERTWGDFRVEFAM